MKNKFTILAWFIGLLWSAKLNGQSISPDPNGVYCPYQTITFSVTLPVGNTWSSLSVSGYTLSITGSNGIVLQTRPANVISQPANITFPGGTSTTFTFTGSFNDDNTPQSFRILYVISGVNNYYDVTYYKIESFATAFPAYSRPAAPPSVSVPRCQTANFNISFPNVDFVNNNPITNNTPGTVVKYGTITQYEYLLPVNWSLNGGAASNGTDWISGTNNVTITPDLSHGDGGNILIRPVHPCGSGLAPAPQAQVAISRPAPALTITSSDGNNRLCSGTKNFTLNGLPAGATLAWTMTNPAVATIPSPPNNISSTITVTRVGSGSGIATLKATVTHCSFTYTVSVNVSVGGPASAAISSYSNAVYCQNYYFQILTGGGPYVYNATVNIVDGAGVATGYAWSNPSGSNNMIWVDNGNGSVTVSTQSSYKYQSLRCTMTNGCGSAFKDYEFISADCSWLSRVPIQPRSLNSLNPESTTDSIASEQIRDGALTIFPNPATSRLTISGKAFNQNPLQYVVSIYDVTGALKLFQRNNGHSQMQIEINKLPAGVYIVELKNDTGKRSYKIIKR